MKSDSTLLNIDDLSIAFKHQPSIVQSVSLSIAKGEIHALVGETGSGKSLTALSILRLLPHSATHQGRIELAGTDLSRLSDAEINRLRGQRVSMIFQDPQSCLNPVKSIRQHLIPTLKRYHACSTQQAHQRALSLLNEVNIPDADRRIHWFPHQFSGGQKQRIMIALALAGEPDLLLADEPTTALDVTVQKQILSLLLHLRKRRKLSILLITHDMSVVATMADRVSIMRHGRLLETADKATFFHAPSTEYAKQLLSAVPEVKHFKSPMTTPNILSAQALDVRFLEPAPWFKTKHFFHAVQQASFELKQGETLALVGESGSGKSTLARALMHLYPQQTQGSAKLNDLNLLAQDPFTKTQRSQQIQIIFQDAMAAMNPRFKVWEIITEGLFAFKRVKDRSTAIAQAATLLAQVELSDAYLYRHPHELSGGQRQRVNIARALAVQPKIVLCDEPTSALDVATRQTILNLLNRLQSELNITYLFISHDLNLVAQFAHRILVMRQGVIVESNDARTLIQSPQHPYTKQLIAAALQPSI